MVARATFKSKNFIEKNLLNIELISISKGRDRNAENEKFFSKDGKQIVIEKNDPLFYYLLRLRDGS